MTENPNRKWWKRKEVVDQVADLRMMLNDFGVSATLTDVSASSSSTVKGVFDNGTELVEIGDIDVEATAQKFTWVYSDVSHAVESNTLAISGVTYKIAGPIIKDVSGNEATLILKDSWRIMLQNKFLIKL